MARVLRVATKCRLTSLLGRLRLPLFPGGPRLINEGDGAFEPQLLTRQGNLILKGYWQEESYFAAQRPMIVKAFTLRDPPAAANAALLEQIRQGESVAVHVRRGDYVANATTNRVHGLCSPQYYEQAVAHIESVTKQPHFFVFSDDIPWTRENLVWPQHTTFIAHNGPGQPHEDLRLMAACRHCIVANSSLSWWGAWLAESPGQVVVAPRQWFANPGRWRGNPPPARWVRT